MPKRNPRRTDKEWLDLIQECRSSGLSNMLLISQFVTNQICSHVTDLLSFVSLAFLCKPAFRRHRATMILLDYWLFGRTVLVKAEAALAGR